MGYDRVFDNPRHQEMVADSWKNIATERGRRIYELEQELKAEREAIKRVEAMRSRWNKAAVEVRDSCCRRTWKTADRELKTALAQEGEE